MSNISPKQLKKTPSDVSTVESHKLKSKEWKERLRSLSKPRHLYSDDSGDEIGPGQYETNDLVLSTVHRSPQVKLYKSSSKSKTNQNETPSSLSYFPNFEAVHTSNPISIFPKADVRRLKFLDELGKRSPGPKYS